MVYLQEFNNNQIQDYLKRVRPENHERDWRRIQDIHNLKDLAHRPLLLDMIVKTLHKLEKREGITAASLYEVYTNYWVDREEDKGRILDKKTKLDLMTELSWKMWNDEKDEIHYEELTPFLKELIDSGALPRGDHEELNDIFREMMTATFLKRDETGIFSFMHRSFMEFFLAKKLHTVLAGADHPAVESTLNTRLFDRKTIYFLTLLDKDANKIIPSLQKTLTTVYQKNISENALQLLYWSARIESGMEEKITNVDKLRKATGRKIPKRARLMGANLREMVLECADLSHAEFFGADLTGSNQNHSSLYKANLNRALLTGAKVESSIVSHGDFRGAKLDNASFNNTDLSDCRFTNLPETASSLGAILPEFKAGVDTYRTFPKIKKGYTGKIYVVAYNSDGAKITSAGEDGLIRVSCREDKNVLYVLSGHIEYLINESGELFFIDLG